MKWPARRQTRLQNALFVVGVLALAGLYFYLIWPGLDEIAYWNDEAGHTLLAQNILQTGLPMAMYGVHSIEDFFYSKNSFGVEAAHGWLSFYLCAASFRLFGPCELTARLPFTLAGALAIAATAAAGAALYGRLAGWLAGLLLTLNPSFLQYCRQTRYYALALLFTAVLLWLHLLVRRGRAHWAWLPVGFLLMFHSSQFLAGVLFATFLLLDLGDWLWRRRRGSAAADEPHDPRRRRAGSAPIRWLKIAAGCLVLIGPWVVFFSLGRSVATKMPYPLRDVLWHWAVGLRDCWNYFPYLMLLGAAPIFLKKRSYYPVAAALIALALIALTPERIFQPGSGFNRRYILHMLPLGALIGSRALCLVLNKWTAPVVAALIAIGLLPGGRLVQRLDNFDRWAIAAAPPVPCLDRAGVTVNRFLGQYHYYRHLPPVDPEKLAMATLAAAASRYKRVLISGANRWQVVYVVGPDHPVEDYYVLRDPPATAYVVVMNQTDFNNGTPDTYRRFIAGCKETIYHDRSLMRVNWAEGPEYPPRHPEMGVWECAGSRPAAPGATASAAPS